MNFTPKQIEALNNAGIKLSKRNTKTRDGFTYVIPGADIDAPTVVITITPFSRYYADITGHTVDANGKRGELEVSNTHAYTSDLGNRLEAIANDLINSP